MTDEMRLTPIAELERDVAAAGEFAAQAAAAGETAPDLTLLQDPAYIAISRDGMPVAGLSVQLRENRWGADSTADVSAVEVLVQDHPFGGESRIAQIVAGLAQSSGRPADEVAREWFGRYAEIAIVPVLHLCERLGVSIQTSQRNTLLELEDGWPGHVVLRETHGGPPAHPPHDEPAPAAAGLGEGPFLDNALSVINALGVAGHVEEIVLLGDLKALLERERAATEGATALLDRLLDDATWPCRANMRTRMHNDIARYVQIPNPLHGVRDQ
jgi:siderophore synthetase component